MRKYNKTLSSLLGPCVKKHSPSLVLDFARQAVMYWCCNLDMVKTLPGFGLRTNAWQCFLRFTIWLDYSTKLMKPCVRLEERFLKYSSCFSTLNLGLRYGFTRRPRSDSPFMLHASGPPESPLQASLMPSRYPAQIMPGPNPRVPCRYWHSLSATRRTSVLCRTSGLEFKSSATIGMRGVRTPIKAVPLLGNDTISGLLSLFGSPSSFLSLKKALFLSFGHPT